jgi:hypothetical protein
MDAITSYAMKAVLLAALATNFSGCAPILALAPLAAGVSLIVLDDGSKARPATAALPEQHAQSSEAMPSEAAAAGSGRSQETTR